LLSKKRLFSGVTAGVMLVLILTALSGLAAIPAVNADTVTQTSVATVTTTVTFTNTATQNTTTTLATGTCGTNTTMTGTPDLIKGPDAERTIMENTPTETASTTTTTITFTQTVTQTTTTGITSTNTVTQTTCAATTPTAVPEFPLTALSALVLVALLLPILLLMKRNGRFQRSTL
jgi:hypothetical protein